VVNGKRRRVERSSEFINVASLPPWASGSEWRLLNSWWLIAPGTHAHSPWSSCNSILA
jgi:hypothetical protein